MHGRCHVLPWLIEFSGVVLSRCTLSRYTVVAEVSPIQLEDSPIPLFKAIVYSRSRVRQLVNRSIKILASNEISFCDGLECCARVKYLSPKNSNTVKYLPTSCKCFVYNNRSTMLSLASNFSVYIRAFRNNIHFTFLS